MWVSESVQPHAGRFWVEAGLPNSNMASTIWCTRFLSFCLRGMANPASSFCHFVHTCHMAVCEDSAEQTVNDRCLENVCCQLHAQQVRGNVTQSLSKGMCNATHDNPAVLRLIFHPGERLNSSAESTVRASLSDWCTHHAFRPMLHRPMHPSNVSPVDTCSFQGSAIRIDCADDATLHRATKTMHTTCGLRKSLKLDVWRCQQSDDVFPVRIFGKVSMCQGRCCTIQRANL